MNCYRKIIIGCYNDCFYRDQKKEIINIKNESIEIISDLCKNMQAKTEYIEQRKKIYADADKNKADAMLCGRSLLFCNKRWDREANKFRNRKCTFYRGVK